MPDFTGDLALLRTKLDEARRYLHIDDLIDRRPQLEKAAAAPGLWDDPDRARKVTRELAELAEDVELFAGLEAALEDADTLHELAVEEGDESHDPEIAAMLESLTAKVDALELRSLLGGEHDGSDAVCELHSGAGGTDAQDWAEMLLAMYQGWAERRGFDFKVDSVSEGQGAGISSADFTISGRNAYGLLQSERGVHRLVRISPFDSDARRHTAFAQFKVVPFFDEVSDEVEIDDKDLRIDTFRSSGAGGQHVNVDRLCGAHHPRSHRHRGVVPKRAQPAPEQRPSHADPGRPPRRSEASRARSRDRRTSRRTPKNRVGQPNPLLCAAPLPASQRRPHRHNHRQRRSRASRRPRRANRGLPPLEAHVVGAA